MTDNARRKEFRYGNHTVTLETGAVARQATGAVWTRMGDTVVLVTVVAANTVKEGTDFFPLTVVYQERTYAAGRIPGGSHPGTIPALHQRRSGEFQDHLAA